MKNTTKNKKNKQEVDKSYTGVQSLWYSVFKTALERFIKLIEKPFDLFSNAEIKEFKELHKWFFSKEDRIIGSFLWISDTLNLSSALIKKLLRNKLIKKK